MITNIYFVRHAHSIYTLDELGRPLSEKGYNDAKKVTRLLSNEKINVIISSPYKRAIETILGVSQHFNLEISIDDRFKERILSKNPIHNFEHVITQVWEDFNLSLDGGESNHTAQKRGIMGVHRVLKDYEGENIVIGTHGNLMVLIMNYFDSNYDFNFWKNLHMPDIYKLSFENEKLIEVNRIWK